MCTKIKHCKVEFISKLINYSAPSILQTIKGQNKKFHPSTSYIKTNYHKNFLQHGVHLFDEMAWNDSWGSAASSPIGVWGGAPGANSCLMHKTTKICTLFLYDFHACEHKFIPLDKWKRFVHIWKQVRTKQTTTVTGIFLYGIN